MDRGHWQQAWAFLGALCGAIVVTDWYAVASQPAEKHIPLWPAYIFGVLTILCVVMIFAPAFRYWPFLRPKRTDIGTIKSRSRKRRAWDADAVNPLRVDGIALRLWPPYRGAPINGDPRLGPSTVLVPAEEEVTVEIRRTRLGLQRKWGPITVTRENGGFFAMFPQSFGEPFRIPLPARYKVCWRLPYENVRSSFLIDKWGRVMPTRFQRVRARAKSRWAAIARGFEEGATS